MLDVLLSVADMGYHGQPENGESARRYDRFQARDEQDTRLIFWAD